MAIRRVLRAGHPLVRQGCKPYPDQQIGSDSFRQLIQDMFDTMHDYDGVGLAAPQIQEPYRIIIYELNESDRYEDAEETIPPTVLVNPTLVERSDSSQRDWEGCLSLPDLRGEVTRSEWVEVRALDENGETLRHRADGFEARILQHELDHLEGTLFVDRMETMESLTFLDEYREYHQDPPSDT